MAQVTQSPGTMANDTSIGAVAWSNSDNAKVSDNVYATVVLPSSNVRSNILKATNFGFSIPTGSTINGIFVELEGKIDTTGYSYNYIDTKLYKNDVLVGLTRQRTIDNTSDTYLDLSNGSGTSFLWGTTWTAEDINNVNFGVGLNIFSVITALNVYADHIRITVYYTEPNPPYDFYLWSSSTLPWQLALPWQYLNGWGVIGTVTNFVITGVNSIFTRLRNLLTSVSSYTITGVNAILSRLRNLIVSVTSYSITGVNANLLWQTAKILMAEVAHYSITTVNSIFSWGRNLFTSNTSYSITTINALLYRLRCLITQTISYTITTFDSVISRPIRNLLTSVSEYVIGSTGVGLYKGWGMLCESTSYLITGINSILSKALNIFTAKTEYTITTIDAIIQRLVILLADTTTYSITTVNAIFTKALNLISSVTDYTITGIDITLSRLRNLITEKAEYLITGIDVGLFRPIRNLAVNTASYIITTYSVIFRGIGDWLWRKDTKPSASDWTNGSKPTNTYNNDNKF